MGSSATRLEAGARQRGGAVEALAVDLGLALADQDERDVGQRREVARRADRALGRDHGQDAALEHRQQQLDDLPRTPECPRRSDAASSASIPRTTSSGSGGPAPTACERTRLSCSAAASSAPMRTLARLPMPVVTP